MELYFAPLACSMSARIALAEAGAAINLVEVDTHAGRTVTTGENYRAINPLGYVPALRLDDGTVLTENSAILQYIASKSANSLWPNDDAKKRADIARWQFWQLAHWGAEACQPLTFQRLVKKILNLGPPDEAAIAKGIEAFNKEAKMLDAHLAKQPYLVGKDLTIADFAVAAPLLYAKEAEMPLGPYANLRGWFDRVAALPCWRETAPQFPAAAA